MDTDRKSLSADFTDFHRLKKCLAANAEERVPTTDEHGSTRIGGFYPKISCFSQDAPTQPSCGRGDTAQDEPQINEDLAQTWPITQLTLEKNNCFDLLKNKTTFSSQ
jgi:hypothetical protein